MYSWLLNGIAFQNFVKGTSGSVKQFITYLSDANKVTSIDKIEYWFDKKKLNNNTDTSPIKEKFKQMMYKNGELTDSGKKVFETIWGNQSLRESLFGEISDKNEGLDSYIDNVEDLKSGFYNFIKIK